MAVSMLWYLLSPIRGTTRAPRLSATHPIRKAFYRHGKTTAQHWLVAMLVSVAIAMGFSYPTIFLSGNPTAGLTAYPPHHFWTTSKPIDDGSAKADVEMRQIWVHGSYMKALDKRVLKQGLAIQQSLVGDGISDKTVPELNDNLNWSTWQWGYHSPLIYWNNSAQAIEDDDDLIKTINEQKHILSTLNIVLRPASVFAGKRFDGQRLQAADALVISLINKVDEGPGLLWKDEFRSLSSGACQNCILYPRDGHPTRHRVYEFGFTPVSMQEHMALTFAYSFMAIYVLLSLRRMKAFHSRFGLVVTAITQMTCSILASFTICNILKINLSMIPQNAYPFVVLVIGLENMFRLINAVLAYPPTMATQLRIANALGDVGPLSVATAAQNLILLSLLSTVVSPGVAAFCAFAAIATLFDVFFLLTFFVAVLNVDIRRLELQDALAARQNQPRHRRRPSPSRHAWFDALIQGRLPFSTRMAGTAVTTTFILSLNYHFFEHKAKATSIRRLLGSIRDGPSSLVDLDSFGQPPMNATLTADEWMKMQDIDTAKEVLQLAKPGADTFVIRIYEPLIIVLSGADRTEALPGTEQWTQAMRTFTVLHFYPVAVAIVFVVAFVAVLMNFLLYNEAGDDDNQIDLEETEDSLTMQTLGLPHKLDVIKMISNESGHFATVGLDRTIAVAIADRARHSHRIVVVPPKVLKSIAWPVRNMALDDSADWIACHGADDSVMVYHCSNGTTIDKLLRFPDDNPPIVFEFISLQSNARTRLHLMLLTSGGRLAMTTVDEPRADHMELSQTPLVGAAVVNATGAGRRLILVTETAQIITYSWNDGTWIQTNAARLQTEPHVDRLTGRIGIDIYDNHGNELLLVTTPAAAFFLESHTLEHEATLSLHRLAEVDVVADAFLFSPPRKCPACNSIGWRKIAISRELQGKDCHDLLMWTADGDEDSCVCIAQASSLCRSFETLIRERHELKSPGAWCLVKSQAILGLRRHLPQHDRAESSTKGPSSRLRQRRRVHQGLDTSSQADQWEGYKLSIDGDMITIDANADSGSIMNGDGKELYVDSPGPAVPLDAQTVAVAFGNTVKVIRAARRTSISRHTTVPQSERSPPNPQVKDVTPRQGR